jgi:hypothetical protein
MGSIANESGPSAQGSSSTQANLDRILKLLRIRLGYLPTAVAQRLQQGSGAELLTIAQASVC